MGAGPTAEPNVLSTPLSTFAANAPAHRPSTSRPPALLICCAGPARRRVPDLQHPVGRPSPSELAKSPAPRRRRDLRRPGQRPRSRSRLLVLGVAGAVLGPMLGSGPAAAVAWYLRSAGIVPIDGPSLSRLGWSWPLGVGTLVTLAAALEPSDRAGRISADRGAPTDSHRGGPSGPDCAGSLSSSWWPPAGVALWPSSAGACGLIRWLVVFNGSPGRDPADPDPSSPDRPGPSQPSRSGRSPARRRG